MKPDRTGQMRIIAGQWRGRKLAAPHGLTTRPTADRARETLFSMLTSRLGSFADLRVADLFAGSGALGLEALSRGAAHCSFVDQDATAVATIRANVAMLGTKGADIRQDNAACPAAVSAPFDLLLADPPYAFAETAAWMDALAEQNWVAEHSWLALERGEAEIALGHDWRAESSRRCGKAWLHFLRYQSA